MSSYRNIALFVLVMLLAAAVGRVVDLEQRLTEANARAARLDLQLSAEVADSNAALDVERAHTTEAELKGYAHGLYDLCMALPLADSAEACLADVAKVYRQAFAQPSLGWRWPIEVSPNPHD